MAELDALAATLASTTPVGLLTATLLFSAAFTVDGAASRLSIETLPITSAVRPTSMLDSEPSDGSNWLNVRLCDQSVGRSLTDFCCNGEVALIGGNIFFAG